MKFRFVLSLALLSLLSTAGMAQTFPKTHLKVVGGLSNLSTYNDYEKPFWTNVVPSLTNGQVTADIKGFNEMGLKGPEVLRLMSQGVIEFGTATLSYFASDNPINEAVDLAGLTLQRHQIAGAFPLWGAGSLLQCRDQGACRHQGQESPYQQPDAGRVRRSAGRCQRDHGFR